MQGDVADGLDGDETSDSNLDTAAKTSEVESITLKNDVGNHALKISSHERIPSTPTTAADDDLLCSPFVHSTLPFGEPEEQEQETGEDVHWARAVEVQSTDRQIESNVSQAENCHVGRRRQLLVLRTRGAAVGQQHAHPTRVGGMERL